VLLLLFVHDGAVYELPVRVHADAELILPPLLQLAEVKVQFELVTLHADPFAFSVQLVPVPVPSSPPTHVAATYVLPVYSHVACDVALPPFVHTAAVYVLPVGTQLAAAWPWIVNEVPDPDV
jgi:hypothetical protein